MKTILIYSGGLDSTTLLYWLRARGDDVRCLGINYGQRHLRELRSAVVIAERLGVPFTVASLTALAPFLAGSSQTSPEMPVPEGHYADASMKQTVVPNRNMLMLAVAGCAAVSSGADAVAYACHAGDHTIYPDCRPEFVEGMRAAFGSVSWQQLDLFTPFLNKTKADIVRVGAKLGVPFADSWSCYKGGEQHCGKCGTCCERIEAFKLAEVADPTVYVS